MTINTKKLIVPLLAKKIKTRSSIFKKRELFEEILFWARECAREFFAARFTRAFLVAYIDDVAMEVDMYMQVRVFDLHKSVKKAISRNCANSVEKTIAWLIDRWINTFMNLTTNSQYLDYIDIVRLKKEYSLCMQEETCHAEIE